MLRRLKIDPEFQSKIPPLTFEELNLLETNILEEGRILNPLIVWNGLIVDGHNRFAILKNHPEIKYTVLEKEFANRYEAIVWICRNQLGRRNLKPEQFKYVLGQQYEAEKLETNFNGNRFTSGDKTRCGQNVHTYKPERTAERIARENNTNEKAVRRAGQFSKGVDAAEKVAPDIKQEILSGSIKPTERAVAAIAKAPPEERTALVQQLRQAKETKETATEEQGESKPKSKRSSAATLQAIRDISDHMLQSNGKMDADDICSELEDALDTMIFRWDTCLKANKTQRAACQGGIQKLTDKGIQYLQKIRRKSI